MANYPPPPGGWGPPGYDPYGFERALQAWATERKLELVAQPDIAFYLSWYPFQYLPRITHVTRELRATYGDAKLFIVEAYDNDPLKQAIGTHRMLIAFVTSPLLTHRAAVRAKSGGGITAEIERGIQDIGNLFTNARPPAFLGDPVLENMVDVIAPTRDEGNWALTPALRQLLVQGFRGILELRAQGMATTLFDYATFEPRSLDAVVHIAMSLYQAAVTAPGTPTPRRQ
jgi:hypothetical protein